jgi:hypothetical protein
LLINVGTSQVNNLNLPLPVTYSAPDGRILYGPYNYDNTSMGKVTRDQAIVNGQAAFHVRVPSDRKMMVTEIYNPNKSPGEITFTVNGSVSSRHIIPPQKSSLCETGIPSGPGEKAVYIEGSVGLILKKSTFK